MLAKRMSCEPSKQLIRECIYLWEYPTGPLYVILKRVICEKSLFSKLQVLSCMLAKRMSCERSKQLICECVLPRLGAFGNFPLTFCEKAPSVKKVYEVNYAHLSRNRTNELRSK